MGAIPGPEDAVHHPFRNSFHNEGMENSVLLRARGGEWLSGWRAAFGAALLACSAMASPAVAGSKGDHDRALEAVRSGQVLPLQVVLERLQRELPGQVLEVELEHDHGGWIYEVKLLRDGGQLVKLKLDARTAAVLEQKNKTRDARVP